MLPVDWSTEEITKEKAVVVKQIDHHPSDDIGDIKEKRYFSNLPNGRPIVGTQSKVLRFSKKQIYDWRDRIFRTDQASVIICGDFSDSDLQQAKIKFSRISKSISASLPNSPSILPAEFGKRTIESDFILSTDWELADIIVSFDADIQLFTTEEIQFLCNMFGRGDGCQISQILREQEGITDEVNAYVNHYGQLMRLKIEITVNQSDLIRALCLLFKELIRFRKEDLTTPFLRTNPFLLTTSISFWMILHR